LLREIAFTRALFLRSDAATILQTSLDSGVRVAIHSATGGGEESWTEHAQARIESKPQRPEEKVDLAAVQQRCSQESGRDAVYDALAERGLQYAPAFAASRGSSWGKTRRLATSTRATSRST
jgi:hypothetical protein